MRRLALLLALLAGCATANAPRAEYDPHSVGAPAPTNPNQDPLVYTHIEGTPRDAKATASDPGACGGGCAADEVCDTASTVHRCVKKSAQPAWMPGAQPASSGGK